MSGKRHSPSDHSQTALTLEIEVEFEWSLSVGYTSLEPYSRELSSDEQHGELMYGLTDYNYIWSIFHPIIEPK
jgi:hypothetical protein